jgi:transcriptional regulator with XRE-family HTH domain
LRPRALGWGVRELAERANITPNTVSRIEKGVDALASTLDRIQAALEDAGVIFIDEDEVGPGVRLRKS